MLFYVYGILDKLSEGLYHLLYTNSPIRGCIIEGINNKKCDVVKTVIEWSMLDQQMKKLVASDTAVSELIYIAIKGNMTDVENTVTIKRISELNTVQMRNFFIKNALKQGEFYSVQLKLSRSDEANMEHLTPELAYIGSYAIHRGKQLEQDIYSVAGLVQLIDTTPETLLRHSLTAS